MKLMTKKIFALSLSLSLFTAPVAFAQDVPANATSTSDATSTSVLAPADTSTNTPVDTADQSVASSTPMQSVDLQGTASPMQDTTNIQSTATSDTLESTTNPEAGTSTDTTSLPPADTEVSTPIDQGAASLDVVAQNIDTVTSETPTPIVAEPLAALPIVDAAPQPEFTFALTGKQIPAKAGEQIVTTPLTPTLDNTGEVTVAGQCSAQEFVVLLFKNPNDYIDNPRSYIVNRAYPCVHGAFTYSITDLPPTLPNGNYYLLVGQQGSTGVWKPITSITEVTINKNQ